jgi:hypothetical protein
MLPFFLLVAALRLARELLNLKTCGLKRRGLWKRSEMVGFVLVLWDSKFCVG